jgi:hypothetical protein
MGDKSQTYADHPLTSGIWMCRGRDMNVLVMDVEGTDGRERGEDQVRLLNSGISSHLTCLLGFRTQISSVLPRVVGGSYCQSLGAPSWFVSRSQHGAS